MQPHGEKANRQAISVAHLSVRFDRLRILLRISHT